MEIRGVMKGVDLCHLISALSEGAGHLYDPPTSRVSGVFTPRPDMGVFM